MPGSIPNTVSAVANSYSPDNYRGFYGSWEAKGSPTKRHMVLEQSHSPYTDGAQVRHLRAFASNDNGVTWAEVDSGNALLLIATPANGTDTSNYSVAQDFNNQLLYVINWSTDATPVLQITKFNQATETWGATVKSTLSVLGGAGQSNSINASCFRPSDGSIWMSLNLGQVGGVFKDSVVKFAAGTLAATSKTIWPALATVDFCQGIALNPLDNTIAGIIADDTSGVYNSFVIHTDDSISTPNPIPTISETSGNRSGVRCSSTGQVIFAVNKAFPKQTGCQVVRYQSADVPASYTVETLIFSPTSPSGASPLSVMQAQGFSWVFYTVIDVVNNTVGYAYQKSSLVPGGWSAETTFFLFNNGTANGLKFVAGFLPNAGATFISMQFPTAGSPTTDSGQVYFEAGAAPPAIPVVVPLQLIIFPFPVRVDCCCPEDIACIKKSGDGKLYAASKGPLRISK